MNKSGQALYVNQWNCKVVEHIFWFWSAAHTNTAKRSPSTSRLLVMSKIASCHCKLPCKRYSSLNGTVFLKCGATIDPSKGITGCNFFLSEEAAEKFHKQRKTLRKNFKTFSQFPLCSHQLRAKVRVVSSQNSKHPGRLYFCCNARLPDPSCDFFHWADQPFGLSSDESLENSFKKRKRGDEESEREDGIY